jgi:Protein of unknown function (DUF3726)
MTELSLNEVESLAAKVGRGSGFSWGLAEEIGRGARLLAQGGFPWANALLGLAERVGRLQSPSPSLVEQWRKRQSGTASAAPLCPMRTAALLADDPTILQAGPLHLENVGVPLWIAGVLAASGAADGFEVAWPNASAWIGRHGVVPKTAGDAWLAPAADVRISPSAAPPTRPRPLSRALVADAALTALGCFVVRVYVPASESSRAKGAGGGSVDDE